MMIGLMTPRRSAPAEGPEDVTAFPGRPLENISARGRYADKGDVSGTEGRRNVEAREDERGTVVAEPHGLRRAEKMIGLELEELPRLVSRSEVFWDALTFSGPSETILVKKITSDESDMLCTDEAYRSVNFRKGRRLQGVGDDPLAVSNEDTGAVTMSSGLLETISEKNIYADGSEHSNASLQDFGNTAEPKNKIRSKIAAQKKERRSFFKQQLRTSRLVFVGLILLSLLSLVHSDAPASSHTWDFRKCVTGQDVLDTGIDLGKTTSPINVSTGLFGGAAAAAIHMDGVSQGDVESASQSLPAKDRGETLGVPPDTTVTLGTEPGCWSTPTPQIAAAASIHTDGISQGDVESASQSLTTNDSQSLTTKDGGEALDVTPEGGRLSSEEKNLSGEVPKKINEPRNISTPTTATKELKSGSGPKNTRTPRIKTKKVGRADAHGDAANSDEYGNAAHGDSKHEHAMHGHDKDAGAKDRGNGEGEYLFELVREGLLDGTTWFEIDHTDSPILAPTTGTWTEAMSNLHEEERKGTMLWSTAASSARIPNAAAFNPALTLKLMSDMKESMTMAASTTSAAATFDPALTSKMMSAMKESTTMAGPTTSAAATFDPALTLKLMSAMKESTTMAGPTTSAAATFDPALTLKLMSAMKESTTMAAPTTSAAATFDPALTSKMMSAMKESTTMAAGNAFRFEVAKILLQLCVSSNNMLQGSALTPSSATISTAANCTDFASPPPSTTKTAGINTHDFEIEGLIECLDAELTSTSNFTLKIDTTQAASFTAIITISDCGPLSPSTTMEIHGPEKEEVCITQTPLFFASIIFFVVVIITSASTFFESPFSGQSPGSNDLEVSYHEDLNIGCDLTQF
ncbi:hypothetical protein TL16_g10112 [Triparma laevis f. inornata]|uniref:Uncharacterized protein n=1 Tax=Triparma laevis f. inornata TaxID=1714386 RepID=A0A9W7BE33_9STRA|nr:hypothetical protein TL16_g10112 [Triparma laevis f. inornata]